MRNEQLDALFPATPDSFRMAMKAGADALTDERPARRPQKLALVCAAVGALLIGTLAYAAAIQWGVLDFLTDYAPTQEAKDIIQTGLNDHSAMAGDVKFELTEAAYDGEQIYLSLKMSAESQPIGDEGPLYADVIDVMISGRKLDFWPAETRVQDGAAYEMIGIPYESDGQQAVDITLKLRVYHEDTRTHDLGELVFSMPIQLDASKVVEISEPVAMNGVIVTQMRFTYSPLKMYAQIIYQIDPELPRFERLRREAMFFELSRNGEPLNSRGGQSQSLDENGAFAVYTELEAAAEPYDQLTITFTGRDGEVYWEHTVDFKEAAK